MKQKKEKPKEVKITVISARAIHNEFYSTEQMLKELQKPKDEKGQKPK